MKKYRIITENGKQIGKEYDNYYAAERYWESVDGIITDDNGNEEYIYIDEI
ncbi:MAG: hypothetical protein IKT44_03760 [Clostridia bacterium]|nr:hypothetical protein [Clostridia bacterium]